MGKFLQITGLVALVAWTAAGFGAWVLTKEQVHVTLEEGSGADRAADDPAALLAERIHGLEEDVRALAAALGENMRALDESIDANTAERLAALDRRVTAAIAALDARVSADLAETHTLSGAVTELRTEWATRATAPASVAMPEPMSEPSRVAAGDPPHAASTTADVPTPPAALTEIGDDPTPPETVAAAEPPPTPEPARKKSFLAFRLPSDEFSFAGRHSWEVIPSLSRVGFDAKSTLHDFTGTTSKVTASLVVDLSHPEQNPSGTIHVSAAALDTGLEDRNTAMCEHLGTNTNPEITFEWTAFEADTVAEDTMKVDGTAKGRMTIHGVTHEVSMPVHMSVDDSRRLLIEGSMPLKMSDYEVEVPSKLGLISVTDQVEVWVALRARPLAKEGE